MTEPLDQFQLSPRGVLRFLLVISAVLVAMYLLGLFLRYGLGRDYALGFVPMFDINGEQNAPTLFSSMLLIGAGALCFFTSRLALRWRWQWYFMAFVFVLLGLDETFGLHEPLFFVLRGNVSESTAELAGKLGGIQWSDLFVWIIIALVLLLAWYWSLIRHVGRKVLSIAVWSAAIYLLGVIGIDNVLVTENEVPMIVYLPLSVIEEVCEFVGVSLFIYAVLVYLEEHYNIVIRLNKMNNSE